MLGIFSNYELMVADVFGAAVQLARILSPGLRRKLDKLLEKEYAEPDDRPEDQYWKARYDDDLDPSSWDKKEMVPRIEHVSEMRAVYVETCLEYYEEFSQEHKGFPTAILLSYKRGEAGSSHEQCAKDQLGILEKLVSGAESAGVERS